MNRSRPRITGRLAAAVGIAVALAGVSADALPGHVLHLEGADARLEVPDAPALRGVHELTVSLWVRPARLGGWQSVVWKGDLPDAWPFGNREVGLFLNGSSVHLTSTPVTRERRGHLYLDTPGSLLQVDRWHHLAAVLRSDSDGGTMRLYVDGELAASRPYERGGIRDGHGPLRLGGIPDNGSPFAGDLDEVQLWGRALSGDEIRAYRSRILRGDEPGLIAYFPFDGGAGETTALDRGPHRFRGRLAGGARLEHTPGPLPPGPETAPVTGTTTTTTTVAGGVTTTTTTSAPGEAPSAAVPLSEPVAVADGLIRGSEAAVLIQSLRHHDVHVRRQAVQMLARLAPEHRAEGMRVALESHDTHVRRFAAGLFGEFARAGEPLTRLALQHSDSVVRRTAATSLGVAEPAPRDPSRYVDWEHKWSAAAPDYWDLEEEGLRLRYNRAEGLYLGWRQRRSYQAPHGLAHYGEVGRGFASEAWRWQAGGELFTWYGPPTRASHLATLGVEAHDLTDSEDGWRISEVENSLDAALVRRDHRDLFRRSGVSAYTAHNIGGVLQVSGRWGADRFDSMPLATDWALLRNGWAEPVFRPNPDVDEGDVTSLRADVQLDTRQRAGADRGWFINAYAERAGGFLGGDYRFKRYLLDLRRYQPMGPGTRLDLRLRAGSAKGDLPRQYLYTLGGLGSLRGYDYKAFAGDRSVLINAQYWIDADRHWDGDLPLDGLGLGVFLDAGAAWYAGDRSDPFTGFRDLALGVDTGQEWKRAVGLAVGSAQDGFRVEFARALDDDPAALEPDGGWSMTARLSRAF